MNLLFSFFFKSNTGIIELPSVYVVPTPYKYDNILVIKYSVKIVGTTKFKVILDVITGGYTATSQVNFAPIAAVSPPQLVSYSKICFDFTFAVNYYD